MRETLFVMGFLIIAYGFGFYRGMEHVKDTVKENLENAGRNQDTIVMQINDTTCTWIPKITTKN